MTDRTTTETNEQTTFPLVSIIIVTYNHEPYIGACLDSLLEQTYPTAEIIVIDNHSSDGSADYVQTHHPTVHLIQAGRNLGFAAGNNLGANAANGDYLAFINPDTTVEPNWLEPLLQPHLNDATVGITTAKLLLMQSPTLINTCGNDVHFTGVGFLRGSEQPSETIRQQEEVASISGAAFLISKVLFAELGGFDENFAPAYVEDTDLSWRAILRGRNCFCVPDSVVYHDYRPSFSVNKYFMIEKNRAQLLLKVYRWPTLVLMIPGFTLTEIVSWGFCVPNGKSFVGAKVRSYWWIVTNYKRIMHTRKTVQQTRSIGDYTLLDKTTYRLGYRQANDTLAARIAEFVFTPIFLLLYQFYRLVIRW